MKIFFVVRGLHNHGGIERVTSVIANNLADRGYQIGIVCLQKGKPYFTLDKGVELHYIPNNRLFRIRNLKKLYAKQRPDVAIFLGSHRSFMNITASKGIPSITWEHFNANVNWHPLHKLSRKLAVKYSQRIVTLTQRDVENYIRLFEAENVICIPNPITIEKIEPSPRINKRVIAIGRLAGQKGFDMLLDAWAKTQSRHQGWKLRIIGSGGHLKKLEKQIKHNRIEDSAEIVGATKDIANEYGHASIMVMSSRYEGLPLVLIEGMAYGLPIVSFDCDTGPSQIIENNKTGILVPPNNIDKLTEELDRLMADENLRNSFSANALQSVERFSTDNIIKQWEELLQEVVNA